MTPLIKHPEEHPALPCFSKRTGKFKRVVLNHNLGQNPEVSIKAMPLRKHWEIVT